MQRYHFLNDKKSLIILLISFIVCLFFIHGYPIYILDEAKNSEAARELFRSGNWIVPMFNGELRTDKPPLHYYFMMLGYKLFGVNAFAARFFSSVFGALTLYMTFMYVKRLRGFTPALITWLILLSSVFFIQVFHQAVPDPYLIFFISCALFSFLNFHVNTSIGSLLLCYLCIGLGTLSKGPVAIALPGLIIAIFLFSRKRLFNKQLFKYRPFLGALIVLAVALPWYLAVHKATNGAWTEGFFIKHNVDRFSSEMEGHGGLFLITWLFVILGLLPFSVFIIQGFINGWKKRKDDFFFFSFLVALVFVLFFSVSGTKLPNYTMPCYPFIAVLIADFIINNHTSKSIKWSLISLCIISILLPIGAFIALGVEEQFKDIRTQGLWLIMVTVGSFGAYYFYKKGKLEQSLQTLAGSWIVLGMVLFSVIYPKLFTKNPVSMAQDLVPKDATVLVYKRFDSAFPFNYQKLYNVTNSLDDVKAFLSKYPDAYIISNSRQRKDLLALDDIEVVLHQKAVFENHHTLIIKKNKD